MEPERSPLERRGRGNSTPPSAFTLSVLPGEDAVPDSADRDERIRQALQLLIDVAESVCPSFLVLQCTDQRTIPLDRRTSFEKTD